MSELIIGIDLGTTNSEVAVVRDGKPQVLTIDGESCLLPSVVGLDERDLLLVGSPARNQYLLHPERTIRSIKRRMGEDEQVNLGADHYTPQEISAMLLRQLKAVAESHLGQPVEKAVITVPAYFSDAQRKATREAGEIAGLTVVRILNEPTAAALAYEGGRNEPRTVLVYDLGGGTFDVSVVQMAGSVVEVLASHGNNHLGGDDFDQVIVEYLLDHLRQNHGVDASTSTTAMARLVRVAEEAKIRLSDRPFALIEEAYLLEQEGQPINLSLELARDDYEQMISPFIDETLQAVHIALNGAGLTVSDLDEVLLVGGASRTPLVAHQLEAALGLAPHGEVDPELCVATGAAIQGAVIAGAEVSTVLVDVTPYTFGTSAIGLLEGEEYPYLFVPVIRKNTPIPVNKSEVFYTTMDGQERVWVKVYQGEDADALNNTEIGSFMLEGLKDAPAGNPIVTTFSLDLDGILHVSSREKATGLEHSIHIDNALSRFEAQELAAARSRVERLFEGAVDGEEANPEAAQPRRSAEVRALVERAKQLMEDASGDDREDLINGVEALNEAVAAGDEAALATAMDGLSDLIYYLES